MPRRIVWMLVIFLLLSGAAHAQAPTLTVYSSVDEENARKLLGAFSRATGIEVRMTFLSTGPALARMEAERHNPQADVWFGAPSENHVDAKIRGLTQPYKSPAAAALDARFRDPDGYWTSFYMNPLGVGLNTRVLADRGLRRPASWQDLLQPGLRGLIQMPSPQTSGTAYNMVVTLVQIMGEDRAFAYMKQLHPNIQTYTASGTAPSRAVAFGEVAVGIQFTPALYQLYFRGYPLLTIFPKEGVGFEAPAISIIRGTRREAEARRLVDWFVSIEGQNALAEQETFFFPVTDKAKRQAGLPSLRLIPLINYDVDFAGKNRQRLVTRWVNEILGGR
ncbi:MAG: ABC transporter substrate-binding protein [Armatimonadota bacterium]|nr:ABC transporter substrate-binding protein [Armatimonadota bacterium]MDR7518579.1 ABC transporter substrate-binding protein [Armatimonadota bacterium]MDR7549699.1 ABC transporter substrate-binding protein [Armatimonadota bacterium]